MRWLKDPELHAVWSCQWLARQILSTDDLMFFFGLEIRTRLSELMSCANVGGHFLGTVSDSFLQYSNRERAQTWLASPGNSSNSCFWRWDKIKREKSRLARTRLHSQHPCHVRYSLESTLKSTTRHIYKSGGSYVFVALFVSSLQLVYVLLLQRFVACKCFQQFFCILQLCGSEPEAVSRIRCRLMGHVEPRAT